MPFLTTSVRVEMTDYRATLLEPLEYQGKKEQFLVPTGYRTDFASVPQFVQWLIPRTGLWVLAAILHDWCCEIGIRQGVITARDTDGLFRRVMRELGVTFVLRWFIWTGVRWGAAANGIRRPGWWKDA